MYRFIVPKFFQVFLSFLVLFLLLPTFSYAVPEVENFDGRAIGTHLWWDDASGVYSRNVAYSADQYQGRYSMEVSYNKNGHAWAFYGFDAGTAHDYTAFNRFGFWAKKTSGNNVSVLVKFGDTDSEEAEAGTVTINSDSWQFVSLDITNISVGNNFELSKFNKVMFFAAPNDATAAGTFLMDEIQFYSSSVSSPVIDSNIPVNNGAYTITYPAVSGAYIYEIWEDTNKKFTNSSANRDKEWQAYWPDVPYQNIVKTEDNLFYYKIRTWNALPQQGGACSLWSDAISIDVTYTPSGLYLYNLNNVGAAKEFQVAYQGSGRASFYQLNERIFGNDFVAAPVQYMVEGEFAAIDKTNKPIVPYYYQVTEKTGIPANPGTDGASSNIMAVYKGSSPDIDNFDGRTMGARIWWNPDPVYTRNLINLDSFDGTYSMSVIFDKPAGVAYTFFLFDTYDSNVSDDLGYDITKYDTFSFMAKKINSSADVELLVKFGDMDDDEADIQTVTINSDTWQKITVDLSGKDGKDFCDFDKFRKVLFFAAPGKQEQVTGAFLMDNISFYKSDLSAPSITSIVNQSNGENKVTWSSVAGAAMYEIWHDTDTKFVNAASLSDTDWECFYSDTVSTKSNDVGSNKYFKVRAWTDNPATGGVCSEWSSAVVDTVPALTVTAPAAGVTVATTPVTVIGTVSANADTVKVNGNVVTVTDGNWSTDVALTAGDNAITVSAEITGGNSAENVFNVVYDDGSPLNPAITIMQGDYTEEAKVAVSLTSLGAVKYKLSEKSDFSDVSTWTNLPSIPVDYTFSTAGLKTLYAKFATAAGVESAAVYTSVTYYPPVSVSITSPADNSSVNNNAVTIEGSFIGNVDFIKCGEKNALINGSSFVFYDIPLALGNNILEINATKGDFITGKTSININKTEARDSIGVTASVISGDTPLDVNFTAVPNLAGGDAITLYEWDFDGDGIVDQSGATLNTASYQYTEGNYYNACLTVTIDNSVKVSGSVMINAYPPAAIWNDLTVFQPYGIAIDSNNDIYVTSQASDLRYPPVSGGKVVEMDRFGQVIRIIGGPGYNAGQLSVPTSVHLDSNGNIYVAESNMGRITKFNSNGTLDTSFGTGGCVSPLGGVLYFAMDEVFNFYVSVGYDVANKYDVNGNWVFNYGAPDLQNPIVSNSLGTIYHNNKIYMVDGTQDKIYVFDKNDLTSYTTFGSTGTGPGEFDNPVDIFYYKDYNYLAVLDKGNSRIQFFDADTHAFVRSTGTITMNNPTSFIMTTFYGDLTAFIVDNGAGVVKRIGFPPTSSANTPLAVLNAFKSACAANDKNLALSYISPETRTDYEGYFAGMADISLLSTDMDDFAFIKQEGDSSSYMILKDVSGTYEGYMIYLIRNEEGIWQIYQF